MTKHLPISNKDLLVYLESGVLVWRIFPYLEKCAAWYVNYLEEWHMLKPKNSELNKNTTQIISGPLNEGLQTFNLLCKKYHLKGVIIYQGVAKLNLWEQWFNNPDLLLQRMKRRVIKLFPNFLELKQYSKDFQKTQGRFGKFAVGTLMGEERQFLAKIMTQKKSENTTR